MRVAARVDANQGDIVKAYRRAGCSVAITSQQGKGFPDIVVGAFGLNELVEIKDGAKPPSARKLTEDEARFCSKWKGTYTIIESEDDVFAHIERMRGCANILTKSNLSTAINKSNKAQIENQIQAEVNKIDWPDEPRIDSIGANGNDGEHYEILDNA